jgi:hypothetical protein
MIALTSRLCLVCLSLSLSLSLSLLSPLSPLSSSPQKTHITVILTNQGNFELQIMIKNQNIKDAPYHPVVESSEPHPGSCEAYGPGISNAQAGVPAQFTIVAKVVILYFI